MRNPRPVHVGERAAVRRPVPAGPSFVELRADAVSPAPASGNPVNQSEIIQRVFARTALVRLGVATPSVAVGQASFPLISTGQDAAFVAKDGLKEAEAGAITPNLLGPVRLQARIQFRVEDSMGDDGAGKTPGVKTWRARWAIS